MYNIILNHWNPAFLTDGKLPIVGFLGFLAGDWFFLWTLSPAFGKFGILSATRSGSLL